jgi:hypothetical protein
LKNKGAFIAIDSLNNNPIYRLNRYLHYLKGERSLSTACFWNNLIWINSFFYIFNGLQ